MSPVSTNADAIAEFISKYALGSVRSFERLPGGTTQTNYLLKASSGDFVIRSYENRSAEYVRFEIDALNQLSAADFPCQKPVANIVGEFVGEYARKPFAIFCYIEGEHEADYGYPDQVASLVARMHRLSPAMRSEYSRFRERYDLRSCLQTAELNLSECVDDAAALVWLGWLKNELAHLDLPDNLPVGLCHCDLNSSNFLYKNRILTAILDFDMAAQTHFLYDVANLLYWWANPVVGDGQWQRRARELLAAYEEVRPLTPEERFHLYDMLKLVFLMSVSWFLHIPRECVADQKGISLLNELGRDTFIYEMFG